MDKGGSAPQAPDPGRIIGLQSNANRDAFNYQTAANRSTVTNPIGTSGWTKTTGPSQTLAGDATNGAEFNSAKYLQANPDVAEAGLGAFDHYQRYGQGEGRQAFWNDVTKPGEDTWTNTTSYTPEQQQLFDAQQGSAQGIAGTLAGLTDRAGNALGQSLNRGEGAPELTSGLQNKVRDWSEIAMPVFNDQLGKQAALDPAQFAQDAADAQYRSGTRYLDVEQGNQRKLIEGRLAEQGFVPGTPAYNQAMETFMDTSNRAYGQARDSATLQGATIGGQRFRDSSTNINSTIANLLSGINTGRANDLAMSGEQRDNASFNNLARTQFRGEAGEDFNDSQNSINQLMAALNLSKPGTLPGAVNSQGSLQGTDVQGPYNQQYQGQVDSYNADVGSKNAGTTAIASILAALAGSFSDIRLKTDITRIGLSPKGYPWYRFRYIWGGPLQEGVMAQEVQAIDPSAVTTIGGFLAVDYSKV